MSKKDEPIRTERVTTYSTTYGKIHVREQGGQVEAVKLTRRDSSMAAWVPVELLMQAHQIITQPK